MGATASESRGRPGDQFRGHSGMLREAGFEDIVSGEVRWPINAWPSDPYEKELGKCVLKIVCGDDDFCGGLDSWFEALLTRHGNKSLEEVTVLVASARKVLRKGNIHAFLVTYVF